MGRWVLSEWVRLPIQRYYSYLYYFVYWLEKEDKNSLPTPRLVLF
jgi:hypothetical protein